MQYKQAKIECSGEAVQTALHLARIKQTEALSHQTDGPLILGGFVEIIPHQLKLGSIVLLVITIQNSIMRLKEKCCLELGVIPRA